MRYVSMFVFLSFVSIVSAMGLVAGELPAKALKGKFVAASNRGGAWDIWTMNADGSGAKQLTDDAHADSDPRWSPGGERILFTSLRKGIPYVYSMKPDGADVTKVTEGCQASWSPEGDAIVFIRDDQAYVRELKSGKERLVTPPRWMRCGFPDWDPNGGRIAVASRHEGQVGIYLVPLEGGEPSKLPTRREACTPRWSPDGKAILFQTSSHVCRIDADGEDEMQLTYGADVQHYSAWSPDGKTIAFCRGPGPDGPWTLAALRLEDEAGRTLTDKHSTMYPDWTGKNKD